MPPSSVSASFLLSFYAVIPQIERSRFFAIFSRATLSERQDRIDGRSVYQCKSPAGGALTKQRPPSGPPRPRRPSRGRTGRCRRPAAPDRAGRSEVGSRLKRRRV